MEKVEKEYKHQNVKLTLISKESFIRHGDRIRKERVVKDIQGKQEWDDYNRTMAYMF